MKKVITYGTFDLFHVGHLNILKRAKALGDYLVVAVSSDAFNALKGKKAYHSDQDRKTILEAIRYVDEVIFEQTRQILFLQGIINREHSHKHTDIRHLIQNLVKCSNCNSTLVPIKNNLLQCSAYIHGNCHSSHSVRIEKIEKYYCDWL